jgi:hypothetical protein
LQKIEAITAKRLGAPDKSAIVRWLVTEALEARSK